MPHPGGWRRVCLALFAVGWGANQFSSMLLVYRDELGISSGTRAALFGVYAAGLVPGLLLGGTLSDRLGRRRVVIPFVALSPVATVVLIAGRHSPELLAVGRVLAGVCSGVVFAGGSAWVQELSRDAPPGVAARRAAIALSAGFALGPLGAAILAEWLPEPLWVPYLAHLALGAAALILVLRAAEPGTPRGGRGPLWRLPTAARLPRFRRVLVPLGPWAFGFASFSAVVLPQAVGRGGSHAVLVAGVANGLTLGAGAAIQPAAKRWEDRRRLLVATLGFAAGLASLAVAALAIHANSPALALAVSPGFGVAYGMVLVAGLRESERLAEPAERGATTAVYLALTYVGFVVPYLVSALSGALGDVGAIAVAAGAVAACAALVVGGQARTSGAAASRLSSPQTGCQWRRPGLTPRYTSTEESDP